MSLKDAKAGGNLSAETLRGLGRALDTFARNRPDSEFDDEWFPARVAAAITGGYSFVEVWVNTSGVVEDKPSGRTNSADDPAVALDGATYAAADLVLCRRGFGGGGFKWELAPKSAGVTVAEVDGAPSYTGTLTLTFDQTDGFIVSQPVAGTARVDLAPATPTQAGGVSIATQTFGGQKSITALAPQLQVQNVASPGPTDPFASLGVASGTPNTVTLKLQSGGSGGVGATLRHTSFDALTLSTASGFTLTANDPAAAALGFDWIFGGPFSGSAVFNDVGIGTGAARLTYQSLGGGVFAIAVQGLASAAVGRFLIDSGTTVGGFARYAARWNGTVYTGGDLDVGGSPAFRGGLYLGGTFVSAGDNNTWTGTNTFQAAVTTHPATDVVPLTVQGGGAGTADLLDAKSAGGTVVFSVSAAGNVNVAGNIVVGGTITATNISGINTGDESPAVRAGALVYAHGRFT
jgi:hypothetical protein